MNDAPRLAQLVRIVRIAHSQALAYGFGGDSPAIAPVLAYLQCSEGQRDITATAFPGRDIDPAAWGTYGPPAVMDALKIAGTPPPDFVGMLFTMEGWSFPVPAGDDEARAVLNVANRRELHTMPGRRSCRSTVAVSTNDHWVMAITVQGEAGVEFITSEGAEANPEFYRVFNSSAVMAGLTHLTRRIQGLMDADAAAMGPGA